MAIPDGIIDQVQQNTDIVDVISRYVTLTKAGRNYKAPCPFHHEKTPSFIVSPDKQIYHCFGCGAGGNVFSFLMRHENMQFPETVEMLAEKAGITLPKGIARSDKAGEVENKLFSVNELAANFFASNLAGSRTAREYLASRGVADAAIKKFRIGYAQDAWESLSNFCKSKGVSMDILEQAGLVISSEKGGYYDRFRNRIMFPIMDLKNRILGFGGRVLDSSLPKYMNSPETAIYSKGRNLYGLNFSKEVIKKKGHALIVEGYLDFLVPYQAGIQNILATLGTALTVDQVKLLKRFAKTVVIVYDPDEAGESASLRGLDLFISEDVNVYIAELPKGFDPDSFIRKYGVDDFLKLVKSSKNLFDYKFAKLAGRFSTATVHGKASIVGEMLPTIAKISNAVTKSEMIKKLAAKLSVDEEAVKTELKKLKGDYAARRHTIAPAEVKRDTRKAEIVLLALLLEGGPYVDRVSHALSLEEFKDSSIRDVVSAIFTLHKANKQISPARLINVFSSEGEATMLISEAVNILDMISDKDRALEDCITRIRQDNVKERLAMLQEAIKLAHDRNDGDQVKSLVAEYGNLVRMNKT
ncbi:MAG: DNA primase [Candidatus Omnitrophica bacterium]|nr:DNA primase [Candidatus Omnitrophota bacterium]